MIIFAMFSNYPDFNPPSKFSGMVEWRGVLKRDNNIANINIKTAVKT